MNPRHNVIRVHVRRKPDRENLQLWYTDPLTGDDVTRSAGTSDRMKAERAAAAWETELVIRGTPTDLSWEQFRVRYEDEHLSGKARRTAEQFGTAADQLERAIGRPRHLSAIDAAVLSQVVAEWRRWRLAETTIHGYLSHLRVALRWAARLGFISRAPVVPMPKLPRRLMRGRPLFPGEYRRIIRATRGVVGSQWRCWVRFQRGLWLSGLRLGEAVQLSWDIGHVQVDLDSGRRPRLRFRAEGQKARRDELAPITPDFARWLRRTPHDARHGPVLPLRSTKGGSPIVSLKRIGRVLSDVGRAAGVVVNDQGKHASAHDFRRSFGTRWVTKVRPLTLKALMRHKSIETTLRYYVDQDADDVADELWEHPTF